MLVPKGISSVQGQIRAAGEIDSLFREALKKEMEERESLTEKAGCGRWRSAEITGKGSGRGGISMWKRNLFAVNAGAGRLYEKQSGVYRFRQRADDADSGWNAHGRN